MAARLIRRASRLLAVPASFQPSSSSALIPPECMRLCQLSLSPPCQAALHTTSLRYLAESLPETPKGRTTPQDENEFYTMLEAVPGVNALLEIPGKQKISGNKGVMIIQQIVKREPRNNSEILNDPRFQQLVDTVNAQIQYIWNSRLIGLMRSLVLLGLDKDNRHLQSVEVEVRWRLRKFNIGYLAQLASAIAPLSRTKEKKALFNDLVHQVELRWTEIRETQTLLTLISKLGFMSDSLMQRLEDKVLELAENFTPEECRKVLVALAVENRRTLSVLRALSFHLGQFKDELSPSVIIDVAFAFGKLNFCQPQLLQKMATDIMPKLQDISSSDIAFLVRSISLLKYSNQTLCEAIAQACLQRSESFIPIQLYTILLGFAHLNFQPAQSEEFFNMIDQHLKLDSLTWQMQVDVVWALCILGHATTSHFQKILNPEVYNQILEENSDRVVSGCLKLLHINATAQLESPDYPGPLLPDDVLQTLHGQTQQKVSGPQSVLQRAVREALKKVFPEDETCDYNVLTAYGWILDGQVVLDSDLKPLTLTDFKASQPLPEEARRFAIVSREFSHFAFREKDILGRFAMSRRHLRAAGFLVVEVPYYDWNELKSGWEQQSYLKDQIKKVMAEDMAQ